MIEFLVDVNLPYKFKLWHDERFQHVREIDDEWNDRQIWQYAKERSLTIITKDVDFSNRIITSKPPPKVIHIKIGNMKLAEFRKFMLTNWDEIERMSVQYKLVDVYLDKITGIN
jgi:predicted nuclease of predicted toxin-antitoxin system